MIVKEFLEGIDLENRTNINCSSSIVFNEYYNFCHITELPINASSFSLFIKDVINNSEFNNSKDLKSLKFYTQVSDITSDYIRLYIEFYGEALLRYEIESNTYWFYNHFIKSVEQYIKDNEAIRQKNL